MTTPITPLKETIPDTVRVVRLMSTGVKHATYRPGCWIALCGLDLIARAVMYVDPPVTCQHCLSVLGCLPEEV